jgi:hypothetical protein
MSDVNTGVCHLAFEVFGQHIWVVHWDLETMVICFVIKYVFIIVESLAKNQCTSVPSFPSFVIFCFIPTLGL